MRIEESVSGLRPISLRDPAGKLFDDGDRIVRLVYRDGYDHLSKFLATRTAGRFNGAIIGSTEIDPGANEHQYERLVAAAPPGSRLICHERVFFPSYPGEWPAEMLWVAAELTLRLACECLDEGFGLKDATPHNVLFEGPRPVFVDVLSFEERDPRDPIWLPEAQFVRTFLLPLLVARRLGLPLRDLFLANQDGLDPSTVYGMLGPLRRLTTPVRQLVSLPHWLGRRSQSEAIYKPIRFANPERARFSLDRLYRRLGKYLDRVKPDAGKGSGWVDYMAENNYSDADMRDKDSFVGSVLDDAAPAAVLDVGCNTGHFSFLASRKGARVVALDSDPASVGRVWRQARDQELDVLPLVVDIANPTPALGWDNGERQSFLGRAEGRFDVILMLAVVHHLMVTGGIPLPEIVRICAALTRKGMVIEFVSPDDAMFRRLSRGRDHLYRDLTPAVFEEALTRHFRIQRDLALQGGNRRLYYVEKTGTA